VAQQAISVHKRLAGTGAPAVSVPAYAIRVIGALLALAVAAVHVADQGGVAAFTSPDWLGWSYRLIEAGGVLTAIALLLPRPAWPGWAAAALLAAGPFIGYLASRTIGVPQDPGDIGNWGDWTGTVSLFVEAALFALSIAMLRGYRRRPAPG
jgi:hypothetical protein